MTANEIRASFLQYFERHHHRIVSSASLVPHDDPTLLFTNAGMNQFKDLFLGRERQEYSRATTAQKCMRVSGKHNDLDNVGPSHRHHTFFEMLGNFSFGDYFKEDAIRFAWELLTEVWQLPPDRLVISVFKGESGIPRDDEAHDVWRRYVPADRIVELGTDDNFWQMGDTGPCGRSSEIYYVRGAGQEPEVEVWNNVFMEFERDSNGTLTPLPAPSIDTGLGLERIAAVLQGRTSNYDTDLFSGLLHRICEVTGCPPYAGDDTPSDVSMRVVADHARAMTFLIADGVMPSNEWRGYVLRKIMRRAMRHGTYLGRQEPFLHLLVDLLAREMGAAYPELRANQEMVEKTILAEEDRFAAVLTGGLPRLESELDAASGSGGTILSGETAFRLYDTFGLPYDFIEDTAAVRQMTIDRDGYDRAMAEQRQKARAQSTFGGRATSGPTFASPASERRVRELPDRFDGYATTEVEGAHVVALFDHDQRQVDELASGPEGYVVLDRTPFYVESGGQVSDTGRLHADEPPTEAQVLDVTRFGPGYPRLHRVTVTQGTLREASTVTASVDAVRRDATRRNHTATHLLHAALRRTLGEHVKQAGSLVAPDRLRFDFVHFQPLSDDELADIERLVNAEAYRNVPVQTQERSPEEAIADGAMALFGEKYGDRVRVVTVADFSMELCGGTHCRATGDIGLFSVVSESGVSAGVRRIEAVTGATAVSRYQQTRALLDGVLARLQTPADRALDAVERLQGDVKRLTKETTQLKTSVALGGSAAAEERITVGDAQIVTRRVADLDREALRALADSLKAQVLRGVVLLAAGEPGKVSMVVSVSKDLTGRVHAGHIIKQIAPVVGGRGGGRPDFAEAGGKDDTQIDELLRTGRSVIAEALAPPA